jgi:aminopeptidase-like protein
MIGQHIYDLACRLWPINRSITGSGVRTTLDMLRACLPQLQSYEVASGTQAFDWFVPKEWEVRAAWIKTPDGRTICNFKDNNLHLVGYSVPVRKTLSLTELQQHLFSKPELPTAIPYVTSYYKDFWGFCLTQVERESLQEGDYEVMVDARHFAGHLTYGELIIPGDTPQEIFLSTYICHPSMANNELSGPVVATFLARWLQELPHRRYTYRIVFIPETIGSIVYLSRHIDHLKSHVVAGYVLTCIGDERSYSFLPSRKANTYADRVAEHVLYWTDRGFRRYPWRDRGSDERQYCAPGVDLPMASIMRTKYAEYPEYHTSHDDLRRVVTPEGLRGGFEVVRRTLEALERDCLPKALVTCEPQLGKRGLYASLNTSLSAGLFLDLLSWADGEHSLLDIADRCVVPIWDLYPVLDTLVKHGLLQTVPVNTA